MNFPSEDRQALSLSLNKRQNSWKTNMFRSQMRLIIILLLLMTAQVTSKNHTRPDNKIIMAYLVPWSGEWQIGSVMGSAILPALKAVKERNLLPGYVIEWHWRDTACEQLQGVKMFIEMWKLHRDLDIIIGDACSVVCKPVALLASAWNIPMVSWGCTSMAFSNKNNYPTFSRLSGDGYHLISMYLELVKTFNWTRVGILMDTSQVNVLLAEAVLNKLKMNNITTFSYKTQSTVTGSMTDQLYMALLRSAVRTLKKYVRIIITFIYGDDFKNFLLLAQKEGMLNGEYVFVTSENYKRFLPEAEGSIITAVSSMLVQDSSRRRLSEDIINGFQDPAFRNVPGLTCNDSINKVDLAYAGLLHDSVLLWAYGLNKTLEEGYTPDNGTEVARNMFNTTFEGTMGTVTIDGKGDNKPPHMINMIQNGTLVPLMEWIATEGRLRKIYKAEDPYDWSGLLWPGSASTVPSDSPPCGWTNELCNHDIRNNMNATGLSVIGVVVVFAIVAITVGFQKIRMKKSFNDAAAFCIPWKEIHLLKRISNQVFTEIGRVRNAKVAVKKLGSGVVSITDRNTVHELQIMKNVNHENVNQFVGVCLEQPHACVLMTYAARGSLYDVLHDDNVKLTWDFKLSLVTDVAQGMKYLHSNSISFHGHLTSSNCVVNSRWSCQITDYGLTYIKQKAKRTANEEQHRPRQMLWTAPELLSDNNNTPENGTQKGDVYSFGIICQEVILQDEPYVGNIPKLEAEEIFERVKNRKEPPYRPYLDAECCSSAWKDMIVQCWNEDPDKRPRFSNILSMILLIGGGKVPSLIDGMINQLESYTNNLEKLVEERSKELEEEKMKMEVILQDLLPHSVAEKLKNGLPIAPESFESITIFFSDIVSFTQISAAGTPIDVVKMLNYMYTLFDDIAGMFDVYKVATIGDAYFVASGVPNKNGDRHAVEICNMALQLNRSVHKCPVTHLPGETLKMRIGIHSGPCVAGVAGIKMPRYLLFGETVDAASNMEATGVSMRIHISAATKRLLDKTGRFAIEERGIMTIKGLGETSTYWLNG